MAKQFIFWCFFLTSILITTGRFAAKDNNQVVHRKSPPYQSSCTMTLGPHSLGLKVKCLGGSRERRQFVKHLQRRIVLPSIRRLARSTNLCARLNAVTAPWAYYSYRRAGKSMKDPAQMLPNVDQLDNLNEQQLLDMLKELQTQPQEEESEIEEEEERGEDEVAKQEQKQHQQVETQVHTHKHYYLVVTDQGQLVELPPFAETLDKESLENIINMLKKPTKEPTSPTQKPGQFYQPPTQKPGQFYEPPTQMPGQFYQPPTQKPGQFYQPPTQKPGQFYQPPTNKPGQFYEPPKDPSEIHLTTSRPTQPTLPPKPGKPLKPILVPTNQINTESSEKPTATVGVSSLPATNFQRPTVAGDGMFRCGERSKGITTNFVNPAHPLPDTTLNDDDTCTFLLSVTNSNVCQVRVDFVNTNMLDPTEGNCVRQHLTVRGTIWPIGVEKFCGKNDDQHFYIEIDTSANNRYVEFSVVTKSASTLPANVYKSDVYNWGLWITQLACDGSRLLAAPTGCFQYYLEASGELKSFNYQGSGHSYLNNQAYRICILAAKGACRISYAVIAAAGSFGLEKFGNYKTAPFSRSGVTSIYCVRDFLRIPDGSAYGDANTVTHDRYCGGHLNFEHNAKQDVPIVAPIYGRLVTVDVRSGDPVIFPSKSDGGIPLKPPFNAGQHGPGFHIKYSQNTGSECPVVNLDLVGNYPDKRPSIFPIIRPINNNAQNPSPGNVAIQQQPSSSVAEQNKETNVQ